MNMNTEEILMVDDERAIRLAVRTALTREGMHVTEAADGSTALDLLKQKHFDLVILDVMMENVSGYQVLQTMRAWGDHTPVMMLSGKSDEMDQVLGLGFGADSYLTKPFHTSVLIQTAKALIRRNQIYSQVWNEAVVDDNTITVYIKRIRSKIEENPKEPKYLKTIRGIGYMLEV